MNQGRTVFAQLIKLSFSQRIQSLRSALWRQQECALVLLLGSVSHHGFRPTYLSRKLARHRSLSSRSAPQALSLPASVAPVKRSTLADANETRDWRIYRDFAQSLIEIARPLYAHSELGLELEATAYAFDATTIDLCLSLFPWAKFRKHKGAIKLHTLLEIHSAIPVFIAITAGDVHEVNLLDELTPEPGSFIVMDRGFIDFQRLYRLHTALAFFVIRTKSNLAFRRRYSHPHDRATGVRSDQTIVLTGPLTSKLYPLALRRVHYYSAETGAASGAANEQLFNPAIDSRGSLSLPLANRIVLQMDQATSAHQKLFRHFRQQRQDPNLDRGHCLCAGSNCQKALGPEARSLHFATDSKSHSFRENAHFKLA